MCRKTRAEAGEAGEAGEADELGSPGAKQAWSTAKRGAERFSGKKV